MSPRAQVRVGVREVSTEHPPFVPMCWSLQVPTLHCLKHKTIVFFLESFLDSKLRVHRSNKTYFKPPAAHVVRMAYQSTLQVLFYGLQLEELRHPQKATGRNHIKRLKMRWREAGGSAPVHFLAHVPLEVHPAASPVQFHEFPEGSLEVSGYFSKAKKTPLTNPKPGKKKRNKCDTKTMQKVIAYSSFIREEYKRCNTALLPLCILVEDQSLFSIKILAKCCNI